MKTEKRRVYLFIAVGLFAACAIGYGVWRASTPAIPSASDIATATTAVSTNSGAARQTQSAPAPVDPTSSVEGDPSPPPASAGDDPYLAPNAVVQTAPTDIDPTVIYRPENIVTTPGGPAEPTSRLRAEPIEQSDLNEGTRSPEAPVPAETTPSPDSPDTPAGTPESTEPTAPTEPTVSEAPQVDATSPRPVETVPATPAGRPDPAARTVPVEPQRPADDNRIGATPPMGSAM